MIQNISRETVAMFIMVLVALTTLGLIVFQTVEQQDISPVVSALLGVVLSFLGTSVSSAQGARQALTPPPDTPPPLPPSLPATRI